ncbi:MAG: phosphatidylglycerophosphate synthase [Candidatus Latescibacterota bacterium]|jgi:phosphatidylglycerophosphate synthase
MTESISSASTKQDISLYSPYSGYPHVLQTASGTPLTVIIDATQVAAFQLLWGMSLVERNVRLVERLGAERIHLFVRPENQQQVAQRRFPGLCEPVIHSVTTSPIGSMRELVQQAQGPVLLLEGLVVYDRRLISALWQHPAPSILCDQDSSGALLVDPESGALLNGGEWGQLVQNFLREESVFQLAPEELETHIASLRKFVQPKLIRVEDKVSLQRADDFLRDMAGKGINDLVAEFLHPPIEFFLTKAVARTRITPNQVSYFNALLNIVAIPLIAFGWLWIGIACNLLRGVMDGVDGKLARLTLRESKGGDRIDHVVDRLYLPLFFLALGWHLGGGNWLSTPAIVSYVLQGFYWANRLLASWFANLFGASSGDFRPIDRLVRRIWPKRNICVWLLLISMVFDSPLLGLYAMLGLSAGMTLYRIIRIDCEGRRLQRERTAV